MPISDHLGKHVGFTARTIKQDVKPKYKNTENNSIFVKNEIVFNEYRAAEAIRQKDECVFVEGHLDVVSLWQAGVKNVVALQGTASPSETVLKRLMRKTKRFVLCMDADQGGLKAISKFLDSVKGYTLAGELDVRIGPNCLTAWIQMTLSSKEIAYSPLLMTRSHGSTGFLING